MRARRLDVATTCVIYHVITSVCDAHVRHSGARHPEPRFPLVVPSVVPHARAAAAAAAAAAARARASPRCAAARVIACHRACL